MKLTDEIRNAIHASLTTPPAPQRKKRRLQANTGGGYRHTSESLAVEPEAVEQVRAIYKAHGVGDVEHTEDGSPVFTSAKQFQDACKARGWKTGRDGFDLLRVMTGREPQRAKEQVRRRYEQFGVDE